MPSSKPRSITSVLRWVLPLALMLACTERGTGTPPSPSASQAAKAAEPAPKEPTKAAPVTPTDAATPATPTNPATPTDLAKPADPAIPADLATPTDPAAPVDPANPAVPAGGEPGKPHEPTDAERVDAYVASCSHRFKVIPEEFALEDDAESSAVDECENYGFDQNCEFDPGGCWDAGQECIRTCGKPCTTCQDECAGGCDACKAKCAPGSTECIRKCAESRLACRTKCMETSTACQTVDCSAKEKACNEAFDQKRKKKCPQCAAIGNCFVQDHGEEDHFEICGRAFPKANKVCLDWCMMYDEDEP